MFINSPTGGRIRRLVTRAGGSKTKRLEKRPICITPGETEDEDLADVVIQAVDKSDSSFLESSVLSADAEMATLKLGIPTQDETRINYATFTSVPRDRTSPTERKSPLLKKFTLETIKHYNLKNSDLPQTHRSGRPIKDHIHLNKMELVDYQVTKEINYYRKLVNNNK